MSHKPFVESILRLLTAVNLIAICSELVNATISSMVPASSNCW